MRKQIQKEELTWLDLPEGWWQRPGGNQSCVSPMPPSPALPVYKTECNAAFLMVHSHSWNTRGCPACVVVTSASVATERQAALCPSPTILKVFCL